MPAKTPLNDDLAQRFRIALSDAYAFVRGRETVQSFNATTFEDLAQEQIDRLTGKGTGTRPSEVARVQRVENEVVSAASKIKKMPASAFNSPDGEKDVNTPP